MSNLEFEKSYVFTHESFRGFFGHSLIHLYRINDYYLSPDSRIREEISSNSKRFVFTKKTGDKGVGRKESEHNMDEAFASSLIPDAKLVVSKDRYKIDMLSDYKITVDFVDLPMKVAILEIESNCHPIPKDIDFQLFGINLIECNLSAWNFFKRKIGIFGAPSCGKTSCAQHLVFSLNTKYNANAFHVVEYATTFIQKYKTTPNFLSQLLIFLGQHNRENDAGKANIVLSDCPTFLAYIYTMYLKKPDFSFDSALLLAKLYKYVLMDLLTYDSFVMLDLLNYKDNKIRYQSKQEAIEIENRIKNFLHDHNVKYLSADYNQYDRIFKELFYVN